GAHYFGMKRFITHTIFDIHTFTSPFRIFIYNYRLLSPPVLHLPLTDLYYFPISHAKKHGGALLTGSTM
ncbi:hypothetical protein, partial [Pelosinus sp. HCF1]|uniref:hypothetical protein n=1 Tax=Pelosinus sp. HCF1 TaxID=1235479 RepID=UPI001EE6731A